jgi:hypothetical protein
VTAAARRRRGRRLLVFLVLAAAATGGVRGWLEVRSRRRDERIASLELTRDRLRAVLLSLSAKDPVVASAPDADVLVGVPAGVATDLLGQVTTRLVRQLEVELRDIEVRKAGFVNVKTLLGRMTPGSYRVDLRIHEVSGVLEPGAPKLDLRGERVGVALPVRIARGRGRATLRFRWDSRGIAGAACGDFRARIPVSGRVVPRTYPVSGSLALELVDGALAVTPSFPDVKLRLQVEPSPETWKAVDDVLGQRSLQCRAALKLADVRGLLRRLLDRGFTVKVPPRLFPPFRLPASLRRTVSLGERTHLVGMKPRRLSVTADIAWLAADVTDEPGAAAPTPRE